MTAVDSCAERVMGDDYGSTLSGSWYSQASPAKMEKSKVRSDTK
jgi:hypothetical protein